MAIASVLIGKERLTHSHIKARMNCPMAEHYRYELELVPRVQSKHLSLGTAVHKGIETGSIEDALTTFDGIFPSTQEAQNELDTQRVICEAMLSGYFAHFEPFDSYEAEIEFETPITNPKTKALSKTFILAGKVDGLAKIDGQWWICEYKTASRVDRAYVDRLQLDAQITTYMHAIQRIRGIRIAGVIYRILKKPTIRQKQSESLAQFRDRIIEDYQTRPDFYYDEQRLYRSQADLETFERELWMFTQRLLQERRAGLHFKNTSQCAEWGGCPYIPLCLGYEDAMELYVKQASNSELTPKGDDDIGD